MSFDPQLTLEEVRQAFQEHVEVVRYLQTGGQGALFFVRIRGQEAALKIYHGAYTTRAQRECEELQELEHEHIVRLLDWGETSMRREECIYTITEFVAGDCLKDLIREQPLAETAARKIGVDVASATEHLWSQRRIVHRDIKPSNIMVQPNGSAVILDLGVAKHRDRTTITQTGHTLGTLGYMSPEQFIARSGLTFKSDLFSLGIVLYECVSKRLPFDQRRVPFWIIEPEPLESIADVSRSFHGIVHSLLRVDPLDRPKSCQRLITMLEEE